VTAQTRAADQLAELLVELIRNSCVNDGTPESGYEVRSVATLATAIGEPDEVVEPVPGRQSAVWRVPGSVPGAPRLALMGHLDVVPANPEGWSVDPFGGVVEDGFVWGRGAVDMLNLTAAMAAVFRPYRRGEANPLPGDLLFLAVADEENGGGLGADPLVRERWDLVGCEALLTEIAYPALPTPGGFAYPVNVGEKGPHWRRLTSRGTPGHGSVPYGQDNALIPLTRAMAGIAAAEMPVAISDEWRAFVEALELPDDESDALLDPERVDAAIERLEAESMGMARYVHACTHLTVSPNVFGTGGKANLIPDHVVGEVDARVLPGQDADTVDDHLRKAMGADADRIELQPVMDHMANSSPTRGLLWEAIVEGIDGLTGSRRVVPALTPAATDARFFRDRGTTCYGVGLFDDRVSFADFLDMFHGNNERVSVDSLGRTADLLGRVLEGWGRRTAG
jgi:acetylornithine deacetylase/succinyl-diaminopimelate desuccinylase-like protein